MADFRKWLVAFAAVAMLLGLSTSALAVTVNNTMTCSVTSVPRQVRGEGVTELVGDLVITCSGGAPTAAGQPVPLSNVHIQLSVPLTSRTFDAGDYQASEALLMIDEPYPTNPFPADSGDSFKVPGAASPQKGCLATGGVDLNANGNCDINGDGGIQPYSNNYNIFQAIATTNLSTSANTIDFNGVPIDPPGTNNLRVIRITNIRGDMTGLLSPNNPPSGVPVLETVSVSTSQNITVNNPTATVAYIFQGLSGQTVKSVNFAQCNAQDEANGPSISFTEGFASSFKTRQVVDQDDLANATTPPTPGSGLRTIRDDESMSWDLQNLPGTNYQTESGFISNAPGLIQEAVGPEGPGAIGQADYGTRFMVTVNNLQDGVALGFDATYHSGNLRLIRVAGASSDGSGGSWASTGTTITGTWQPGDTTSDFVVYEVVSDDPTLVESVTISPSVSYTPDLPKNVPALDANSTASTSMMSVSFAPIAADHPGLALPMGAPNSKKVGTLPRFVSSQPPQDAVIISPCSCNLLYPWVATNDQFDTGLVVVNTSADPFGGGSDGSTGVTTLYLYGAQAGAPVSGLKLPPASAAAIEVPPGCALAVVMSTGGGVTPNCNADLPASNGSLTGAQTADFIGYVIAVSTYQYCHGVAYVSPRADPLHGSYYEAIELDKPFALTGPTRTLQSGESQAH